jgi:hypothetical protein
MPMDLGKIKSSNDLMPRWNHAVLLIAALASKIGGASAFVGVSPNNGRTSTELYGKKKTPPLIPMPKDISYGEESRRYRRTVYSHDDWVKHRSPDRFSRNMMSVLTSGIYKNIQNQVAFVTCISAMVVLWNALVGGYTDFKGVKQAGLLAGTIASTLTLPMGPFTLSSASLGLLLGTSLISDQSLFVDSIRVSHYIDVFFFSRSVPHKHRISTLGRSAQELGYEHQSYP